MTLLCTAKLNKSTTRSSWPPPKTGWDERKDKQQQMCVFEPFHQLSWLHAWRDWRSAWWQQSWPISTKFSRAPWRSIQYHSRLIPNFAANADVLFKLQAEDTFVLLIHHEKCLRELLEFLKTEAVIHPFSMKCQPTEVTNASVKGLGRILKRNGHPVICISRHLTKAEEGYS